MERNWKGTCSVTNCTRKAATGAKMCMHHTREHAAAHERKLAEKKRLAGNVISLLKEMGCGNIRIACVTPSGDGEYAVVINEDGTLSEMCFDRQEHHADFAAFKAAWTQGADV